MLVPVVSGPAAGCPDMFLPGGTPWLLGAPCVKPAPTFRHQKTDSKQATVDKCQSMLMNDARPGLTDVAPRPVGWNGLVRLSRCHQIPARPIHLNQVKQIPDKIQALAIDVRKMFYDAIKNQWMELGCDYLLCIGMKCSFHAVYILSSFKHLSNAIIANIIVLRLVTRRNTTVRMWPECDPICLEEALMPV